MEAIGSINYKCGCGFQTKDKEEAIKHSQATGHSLTALGSASSPSKRQLVLMGGQFVKARKAREADEAKVKEMAKAKEKARLLAEAEKAKVKKK